MANMYIEDDDKDDYDENGPRGLFVVPQAVEPEIVWTDEQQKALNTIDRWCVSGSPFFSLTGPAGTGKSTLLHEFSRRHTSVLTAMTGKAALRLSQVAGGAATTLHSVMYYPPRPGEALRFVRLRKPPYGIVVIDEASMMGPTVLADLRRWGVRALLVGDIYQLPPVITGEELKKFGDDYSVFKEVPGASLYTVMRSAGAVLRAAERVRATGDICLDSATDEVGGYELRRSGRVVEDAVNAYLEDPEDHLLITWRNALRMQANHLIRSRLGREGPLPDEGEPVLIRRNGQGFLNGEIVRCGGFEDEGPVVGGLQCVWMRVQGIVPQKILVSVQGGRDGEFFDGNAPWVENWRGYHIDIGRKGLSEPTPITWGYCVTAHSAQGSEARRATVFLERGDVRSGNFNKTTTLPSGEKVGFKARWTYTAMTRSKSHTLMIVG